MAVIQVDHLTKRYKAYQKEPGISGALRSLFKRKYFDIEAVNDISFDIKEGELVGFIGPNGAGKTTTLKCLSGLLYPTLGKVSVLGYTPFQRKPTFLKQISLVMGQKNQLWWDLPAMDTFLLNKEIYEISDEVFKRKLKELSELLDIEDVLQVQVRKLSLGQRMKCELAAALLHSPKVLFLDEPTIGLDVIMQQKIREFIKEYNQRFKSTIILTSHYMDDVKELCKRVIIIDRGKLIFDGKLDQIIKKYAKHKLLSILLEKHVPQSEFERLGKVKEYRYPRVTLTVPTEKSNRVAAQLLETYPVEDLTIQEEEIEDIIRKVFRTSK